jgi:hypothetical protein
MIMLVSFIVPGSVEQAVNDRNGPGTIASK